MSRAMTTELRKWSRMPLFEGCSLRQLKRATSYCTFIGVEPGCVLHRRQERPDSLVVLVSGHAVAVTGTSGLELLGPGECFGALAPATARKRRPDMVVALTAATVATLTARELAGLLAVCPSVALHLRIDPVATDAGTRPVDVRESRNAADKLDVA